ncbi:uncharacterized protein BXZ73DRAFT_99245 [Epithele typhae]|uniref:uncharacterized protein n=1 Tax=Epithele typhae TaxID=378194 RepID=UPI002008E5A8|nr:uncharacterized protein BXZ73DRAFT_99245 [Epithele typhae]KAH9939629.1 hypothetical protein BXZ73DRAFT_99245 [Epithele typhae]
MNSSSSIPPSSTNPTAAMPAVPSLNNTFGAMLIGSYFALMMYGAVLTQSARYFRHYNKDPPLLRSLVAALVVTISVDAAVIAHMCYYYLVLNYFDPLGLLKIVWSESAFAFLSGFTVLICDLIYLWRVYRIARNYAPIVALAFLLVLANFGLSIVAMVFTFYENEGKDPNLAAVSSAASASSMTANLIIATTMILSLHKSRTGIRQTDSLIHRLILYTLGTGVWIVVGNLIAFVFALVRPNSLIWMAFDMVVIMVYPVSLLAQLNSRRSSSPTATQGEDTINLTSVRFGVSVSATSRVDGSEIQSRAALSDGEDGKEFEAGPAPAVRLGGAFSEKRAIQTV